MNIFAVSGATNAESSRKFEECFKQLGGDLQTTHEACEQIKQILESQIEKESQARHDRVKKQQADLEKRLAERGDTINRLEQKMQLLSESYTAQVDSLARKAACNDEAAQRELCDVVTEFRGSLQEGFHQERERSERNLRQHQTAMAALEGQLKAVNDHLAVAKFSASQENNARQSNDKEDRGLVAQLQRQVHDLERQARATEELRERWKRDIRTVDGLRAQLKDIEQRVPQVERFDLTLSKMAEVNEILYSTAKYLADERAWARQTLEGEADQMEGSREDSPEDQVEVQSDATEQFAENQPVAAAESAGVEGEQSTSQREANEALAETSVDGVSVRRKVTVYSPAGKGDSPWPPLSIEQEQIRRREAANPRSILKHSASSQESGSLEEQAVRMTLNQSQYNRPVMGKVSVAVASAEMVEEIRSGLVRESQTAWTSPRLPTLKETTSLPMTAGHLKATASVAGRVPTKVRRRTRRRPSWMQAATWRGARRRWKETALSRCHVAKPSKRCHGDRSAGATNARSRRLSAQTRAENASTWSVVDMGISGLGAWCRTLGALRNYMTDGMVA